VSKSSINKYLAEEDWTYKTATTEEQARNSAVLIEERFQFAKMMLEKGERPEDPSQIICCDSKGKERCLHPKR